MTLRWRKYKYKVVLEISSFSYFLHRNTTVFIKRLSNDGFLHRVPLQNVIDMTDVCHALIQEGHTITEQDLSHMSPYMTEHLKRFGEYVLDLNLRPANLNITREKFLFKEQSEPLEYAA